MIGEVSPSARRGLIQTTFDAMFIGIRACKPGCTVTEIGRAIESFAKKNGYSVVREYQGHGIGRDFHQEPVFRIFRRCNRIACCSGRGLVSPLSRC